MTVVVVTLGGTEIRIPNQDPGEVADVLKWVAECISKRYAEDDRESLGRSRVRGLEDRVFVLALDGEDMRLVIDRDQVAGAYTEVE